MVASKTNYPWQASVVQRSRSILIPSVPSNHGYFRNLAEDLMQLVRGGQTALFDQGLSKEAMMALDEWLQVHPEDDPHRRVVELCIFAGLEPEDAAEVLQLDLDAIHKELCRAHLYLTRRFEANNSVA